MLFFYLVFFLGNISTAEDIIKIKAPLKSRKSPGGYDLVDLDVLDPFDLVHYLWNVIGIDVPEAAVRQYWQHHRSRGSAWALHSQASECTMPLGLYGDSVKVRSTYQGLEKMVGIFLNVPLYRPRSVRCSRWLLCTVQEHLLHSHHTLDCIFRYLTWALNQLYTGKFPTCGPDGEALTGKAASRAGQWVCPKNKLTFQVTELRGDWLWHKQVFRFRSSWKGGSKQPVCFKCKAWAKGPVDQLYYHIEENSPLWSTEYPTVVDFLVDQCPDRPCTLAYCDFDSKL